MNDVDNRLSAIDLSVPGGRFVVASDGLGNIASGLALLPQIRSHTWVDLDGTRHCSTELSTLRRGSASPGRWPRSPDVVTGGFGVFLNQWAWRSGRFIHLPFFFTKTVNAPADALQPTMGTDTALLAAANGSVGGSTMDHDFRTEFAKNYSIAVQRELTPSTMVAVSFLRSAIVGADSSTVLNVPLPGPGAIGARRPVRHSATSRPFVGTGTRCSTV
jgi:hypothetical protein